MDVGTSQNGAWPGHEFELLGVFHGAMAAEKPSGAARNVESSLNRSLHLKETHDCDDQAKLCSSSASQRQCQSHCQSQKHRQKSSIAAVGIVGQRRYDVSGLSGLPCCRTPYSISNVRRPRERKADSQVTPEQNQRGPRR